MFCKNCGSKLPDNARFCKNCGARVPVVLIQPEQLKQQQPPKQHEPPKQSKQKKKGGKAWIVVLLILLIIIVAGATVAVLFIKNNNTNKAETNISKEDDDRDLDEDEDEEEEIKDRETSSSDRSDGRGLAALIPGVGGASTSSNEGTASDDTESATAEATPPIISMDNITYVYATSELSEYGMTHYASNIIDGTLENAWVEGVSGQGEGEEIILEFDDVYYINGIDINAGYQKNENTYEKNSRPMDIEIDLNNGQVYSCSLDDIYGTQSLTINDEASLIIIRIKSVYPGSQYEDTVISEVYLY